jgi:hypothetical protein
MILFHEAIDNQEATFKLSIALNVKCGTARGLI